jgi:hypothetical protein
MNRKVLILSSVLVVLIIALFLVAFKVTGSSESQSIGECVPYNVVIEKGENEFQASIRWLTKGSCTSFISYGNDRNNLNLIAVESSGEFNSKKHHIVIDKLLTYKTYYFLINSDSQNYGIGGSPLSFTLNSL